MKVLSAQYPRYGYRRIRIFLGRDGHRMSPGRAYRLWRAAGLQVPRKRPRKRVAAARPRPQTPSGRNQVWSYDFVFDHCANGQQLKCLTVTDEFTKEGLAIDVDGRIRSPRVIEVLSRLVSERGAPTFLRSDNGPKLSQRLEDSVMRSSLTCALLIVVLAGPAATQPIVRDHRVPGEAAQWTVDRGAVGSLSFHRLYNTQRRKHLDGSANSLSWEDTRPGMGRVFFENCTRLGEVIYGSDLVAIRFGGDFVAFRNGSPVLQPSRTPSCEFRLIPSGLGLVPVGSGDGKFALYSTRGNRYLVYRDLAAWQVTSSGQPRGGVAARADFVPVDLFFTSPSTVYLTIQTMATRVDCVAERDAGPDPGTARTFLVTQPIPPCGTSRTR
jgi:hypothetical protein